MTQGGRCAWRDWRANGKRPKPCAASAGSQPILVPIYGDYAPIFASVRFCDAHRREYAA